MRRARKAPSAGAKLVELPAAHLSNIEARDRFTGEIANFLEGAP
jgi:pimeloyl-ACP methyl ester carboxylesterase